ncbi:DNA mismatch repair protein MutS [Elizabethkingia anophelis]|uniref:DNA mismatch repair protein MutS n=1 Tax=Elizabethkingia anophelis TaxID=1117645 RepID=UPI0021A2ECF4|nr:DNA mismatch repair protein MutS [Elizabethkingia anophelis]MCT3664222.1 DNA mismatch repair protein MutS [Elizabethkingia anophelis]MCT3835240.1 DNA mismatch repair protein MutS [Elizabethkingia anophelis]MCT3906872.1 DNA mismatch repair protein MutS [Elizabethkingia anophelis]MCT3978412.1 DNA mismatch repair protein MutS [Elizabethkingia anophelis]MCT4042192.1 DNA mismatch repair protein MutS [Elizabethkingia anophelis]
MAKEKKETPLMGQYNSIKAKYPDALLLFRVGDFYETFGQDAVKTSQILGIVLTKRANGSASHIELAGFPHHSLDSYLPKLVRAGMRVAICDQLEDPKMVKGIVKRGVTELVTPGVTFNDQVLNAKRNNFLLSLHKEKEKYGIALVDISTGEFLVSEGNLEKLLHIVNTFDPSEIILQRSTEVPAVLKNRNTFKLEDWAYQYDYAYEKLTQHFKTKSLKGFGIDDQKLAIVASGAIFAYLVEDTHHSLLNHITKIQSIPQEDYLMMDAFTLRNLEIVFSSQQKGKSLLDIIDKTSTPMGGRLLRRRLILPLKNINEINRRLSLVEFLNKEEQLKYEISLRLRTISDLDRLMGKLAAEKISPKELGYLRQSLENIQEIKKLLIPHPDVLAWLDPLNDLDEILQYVYQHLNEELPVHLNKGNVIKEGVSEELDRLRNLQSKGKGFLDEMRDREIERTGIPSLKIDFNNVFGYFIEVRNTHKDKVPEDWIRKQTLVNAERYITEELKEYESQILGAEEKISLLESELYRATCTYLLQYIDLIQENSALIAQLDCALGLSELSVQEQYTKPVLNDSFVISISEGRHPIIEKSLPLGEKYIPNDIYLDQDSQQIIMVTGPNMAGKSAILRQTAIICLLAQIGSYVPAKHAEVGLLDKIFTRVGASDNIAAGESTFMVEMNEAANILNNISDRSLILLDEIGRGTSTYDGVSIAWAIAEYLHQHTTKPKTLFATHYHELNEMTVNFERIKNFSVSIQENKGNIIFLRKLIPGGSEHSFGIHVAKLAGMPSKVVHRAEEILKTLEDSRAQSGSSEKIKRVTEENMQLSFFQLDDPVLENIREELTKIDINTLTPIEALMKLNSIKKMIGG